MLRALAGLDSLQASGPAVIREMNTYFSVPSLSPQLITWDSGYLILLGYAGWPAHIQRAHTIRDWHSIMALPCGLCRTGTRRFKGTPADFYFQAQVLVLP